MIRFATEKDLPAMLAIYKPYVEETTYSFEYDTPCLRTFTQRFYDHVAQFPWLVWEEDGAVLGYAYAGAPGSGRPTAGARRSAFTCTPASMAGASAGSSMPFSRIS